ncbi:hypothetical protein [Chloracidobacterium thermophilum]|uniref:hypothetical protein n=1 Tax=Chloracidobacterium thermophilum TaxID=458033 RepID=UPI0012FEFB01|nr:hypothetical protein [Chloracidobacterium thermophilum]
MKLTRQSTLRFLMVAGAVLLAVALPAQAETLKKRYTFDYNPATRSASEARAKSKARKQFLADFLEAKFSRAIIESLAEEIDIALDPPDEFLTDFKITNTRFNDDETKIILTVEGDVNLPAMVSALVQNKVLSFGERPPRVMFLPSSRFDDPKAAKTLRALVYEQMRQAGLQSVAFEGVTEITSVQIKQSPNGLRVLAKQALQYGADYLIYVDPETDNRPASIGGHICDANFIYTVMRPNDNRILGEGVITTRGSANSGMVAFGKAMDEAAPILITRAVGQLYQSIFADSDVIYDQKQLKNNIALTVYGKTSPQQTQAIIKALQAQNAYVTLGVGGVGDRMTVETTLEVLDLYNFFNDQTFEAGGMKFKAPVVGYGENTLEVEIVTPNGQPRKARATNPPPRRPRPSDTGASTRPKGIVCNLKPSLRAPAFVQ